MEPSEEAGNAFHCVICLDLVYKPIVQSCGHVFCFWCVHRAMDNRRQSHCPVCRRPYMHFPRVCELLHFMMEKAVPDEYERRRQEIQRMEEERQVFSPRILESPKQTWSPRGFELTDRFKSERGPTAQSYTGSSLAGLASPGEPSCKDYAKSPGTDETCFLYPDAIANREAKGIGVRTRKLEDSDSTNNVLTVDDFSCSVCKKLLYRPVVLNCGEVFCEICVQGSTVSSLRCPSCNEPHRGGLVLVCLELHQYLERAFPTDYAERRMDFHERKMAPMSPQVAEKFGLLECSTNESAVCGTEGNLHVGVGCDGCGMFPIVGNRFKCRDCPEKIGYDLCGACHRKGGDLSGRFNQQHKSCHHMMEVRSARQLELNMVNGLISRRRQQQQLQSDLDDYFNSFLN